MRWHRIKSDAADVMWSLVGFMVPMIIFVALVRLAEWIQ